MLLISTTFLRVLSIFFSLIKTSSLLYGCIQPQVVAEGTLYLESEALGWRPNSYTGQLCALGQGTLLETLFPSLFFCSPIPNLLGDPVILFVSDTFIMANYSASACHCYIVTALFFLI